MSRLLLVSNRLPVTVRTDKNGVHVQPSAGGLATGLSRPHAQSGGLWLGWPGDVSRLTPMQRGRLEEQLEKLRCVPIYLSASEVSRYYEGFSNRVLWPLFHSMMESVPMQGRHFEAYRRVNTRFAEVVALHYKPGDTIWVHDYQLLLVPGLLRERLPEARIGFFLHIPFPPSELFRTLPWREELLRGMLGADVVGFHTVGYLRNFASSFARLLGVDMDVDRVQVDGRAVRIGAFPMGIDAASFDALARDANVVREAEALRAESPGQALVLGIDRLDYTKGIPRRLLAVQRLLEREPSLRRSLRFVQVAVPSRENVDAYEALRREVDMLVGRINGQFGTVGRAPVHYLYRSFNLRQLVALYRAADVMLVTPLRDGMNLVAKEFVASRPDEDGALVLSEFAGAAAELGDAVQVNPYDIDQMARTLKQVLDMPREERARRMQGMRRRVMQADVHHWVADFLAQLEHVGQGVPLRPSPPEDVKAALRRMREAKALVLMLDYDGTLMQLVRLPEMAAPDAELLELLRHLSARPGVFVHLVSGRPRETMQAWFGALPVGLHAEHGLWSRRGPGYDWRPLENVPSEWKERVRPLLEQFAARVPGAFVEEKSASLAWHYRQADSEFGAEQARELRLHLAELLKMGPLEVMPGNKVVEVRPRGVHKGRVVADALAEAPAGALAVAFGDDCTDEDLFAALPADSLALHVGPGSSRAPLRLAGPEQVRALLRALL